jgi:steroid 5-alpha reductase family enzyme
METVDIMTMNFLAVLAMMLLGWVASLIYKNVTHVDSLWGVGFVLIAWLTFGMADGFVGRRFLITLLVSLWGLRLSLHLSRRNWGHGEDPRYAAWRQKSGNRFWLVSLVKVFILQAVFLWVISVALQWAQLSAVPDGFTAWDYLGLGVWMIGFIFEAFADQQLYRFKADSGNKGKVMDKGLWAYSRHPNYFGESLMWWGIFLIALSTPAGWWTVISPVVITVVLLKMTGVSLMEKTIVHTKPGYNDYIARTNAFIPWFPKKSKEDDQ